MADRTTLTDDELLDKIIDELEFSARQPEHASNNVRHDRCGNVYLYEMVARLVSVCNALKNRINRQNEMIVQLERRLDSQTNEEQPDQHEPTVEGSFPMQIGTAEIDTGREQQIKQEQMVQGSNQSQTETDEGLLLYDSDQEDVISMRTDEQSRRIESLSDESNQEQNGFMARRNNVSLEDHYKSDEHDDGLSNTISDIERTDQQTAEQFSDAYQNKHCSTHPDEFSVEVPQLHQTQVKREQTIEASSPSEPLLLNVSSQSEQQQCSDREDIITLSNVSMPSHQMKVCFVRLRKINAKQIASNSERSKAPAKSPKNTRKKSGSHTCGECNKSFVSKRHLDRHSKAHTGERPYKCTDCTATFKRDDYLKSHRRVHTGEKPYMCMQCGRVFKQASTLKYHSNTHSAERPFVCTECGVGFKRSTILKRHQKIHSGEKPFICDICKKSFRLKSELLVHMCAHSGKKSYKCNLCELEFCVKLSLKKHLKVHIGSDVRR